MKNRDMPAMPIPSVEIYGSMDSEGVKDSLAVFGGLTKREHFAGLAMQGLLSTVKCNPTNKYAIEAVNMADALLEALEKDDETSS